MKDKKIFDILDNAENDSMERLIDKCPEITDEQLEKILVISERKYNMKKSETKGIKNIEMLTNDTVEGVERSKRPAWIAPLSTAASLILVAGIIFGSTAMIKKNGQAPIDDSSFIPAASVTTSTATTVTYATNGTAKKTGSVTTVTSVSANTSVSAEKASTEASSISENEVATTAAEETNDIASLAGTWNYYQEADHSYKGIIEVRENGTFTYTTQDGSTTIAEGVAKFGYEEIGEAKITTVNFIDEAGRIVVSGYYDTVDPDTICIGNSGRVRLIRGAAVIANTDNTANTSNDDFSINDIAGEWLYEVSDDERYTVDISKKLNGTIEIHADSTYVYNALDGSMTKGTVETGFEEIEGTKLHTVIFYENGEFQFAGYYRESERNIISIGNGGMARLVRQ